MNLRNYSLEKEFKENGFVVLKDILNPDEINIAREQLSGIFRETSHRKWWSSSVNLANCLAFYPELSWVALNQKIVQSVMSVLGDRDIAFVNVFGIQKNMLSGWHRDDGTNPSNFNSDGSYFGKVDMLDDSLKCLRVAIYLQNHHEKNPGLYVKSGSHLKRTSVDQGGYECLKLSVGDVIIFDVRLVHSGTFPSKISQYILKNTKGRLNVYVKVISDLIRKFFLLFHPPKLSIFLVYGLNNKYTSTYGFNMMRNQQSLSGGESYLPRKIIKEFEKMGIKTLDTSR